MIKSLKLVVVCCFGSLLLTACGSTLPLMFADKTSAGIDISGSEQGVDLVLGFKTKSIAVVPVAVRLKDGNDNYSSIERIQAEAENGQKDAYSTFGNFTIGAKGQATSASVGLGRFFATGMAAQKIAEQLGKAMVKRAETGQPPTLAPAPE